MTGAELILEERKRQIEQEGWSPEHDDRHTRGELAVAAACYMLNKGPKSTYKDGNTYQYETVIPEIPFPWLPGYDRRDKHDAKRSCIIAGALAAAEWDRLDRLEKKKLDLPV